MNIVFDNMLKTSILDKQLEANAGNVFTILDCLRSASRRSDPRALKNVDDYIAEEQQRIAPKNNPSVSPLNQSSEHPSDSTTEDNVNPCNSGPASPGNVHISSHLSNGTEETGEQNEEDKLD